MRDENTKKQHSAQALSDDDLESVGGGWYGFPSNFYLYGYFSLSKDERKKLKKLGCKLESRYGRNGQNKYYKVYQNGKQIDDLSLLLPQ